MSASSVLPSASADEMGGAGGAALGVGDIRHRRMRPASNAFVYRGFFLRLPLRALGTRAWPWRLLARNRFGLLSLHDADHGDGTPLLDWAQGQLADAQVHDADGEIWLHTFPRMAGFVFNPVSFWFCERADGALRAVICEVNNTFGDRHVYLLAHANGQSLKNGEALDAVKRFHVSPFCEVTGHYRFRFAFSGEHGGEATGTAKAAATAQPTRFVARIDHGDAAGALLTTAIGGRLLPLTDRALLRVLLRYPAFTLGVVLRIHWQALKLWRKRVPFHARPLPPATGVTLMIQPTSPTSPSASDTACTVVP